MILILHFYNYVLKMLSNLVYQHNYYYHHQLNQILLLV